MRLDESVNMRHTMLQNTLPVTILKRFSENVCVASGFLTISIKNYGLACGFLTTGRLRV